MRRDEALKTAAQRINEAFAVHIDRHPGRLTAVTLMRVLDVICSDCP
jgi:hypothetical protein